MRKSGIGGKLKPILFLIALLGLAWGYAKMTDQRETIASAPGETIRAADGDSFVIGARKLRLTGIDAPELKQTCKDASGTDWACGAASHGALTQRLAQPSLACEAEASDRFGRALATCSTAETPDIAAAMVSAGLAISNEFYGMRDYGEEEDAARAAKRGIWRGAFTNPREWREANPRARR